MADTGSHSEPILQIDAIQIVKTGALDLGVGGIANPGDIISYTFTVTNTGNTTLSNVALTDTIGGVAIGALSDVGADGATVMAPGAMETASGTYGISQADIDDGVKDNTADVDATDPDGNPVNDDDTHSETIPQNPAIELVKSLLSNADEDGSGDVSLGDTLTYEFVATNTGNVTLSNVSVSDPLPGLSTISPSSVGSLGPNAATTFSATYTVTAADVTAGQVANTAVASGTAPDGSAPSDDDSENVPVVQAVLSISKTSSTSPVTLLVSNTAAAIAANSPEVFADAMDTVVVATQITYTITVTNTGDDNAVGVSLTDSVPAGTSFVSAGSSQGSCSEAGGTVTCGIGTLAANGGSATVTLVVQTN